MASNPMTDVIPAKARKYVYALVFVAALALAAYQAAGGDWREAVVPFVTALIGALAASNTDTSQEG